MKYRINHKIFHPHFQILQNATSKQTKIYQLFVHYHHEDRQLLDRTGY